MGVEAVIVSKLENQLVQHKDTRLLVQISIVLKDGQYKICCEWKIIANL